MLVFSVPLAIGVLWRVNVGALLVILAIMMAMILHILIGGLKGNRSKAVIKENLAFLFLILSTAYLVICIVGVIQSIMEYLQVV